MIFIRIDDAATSIQRVSLRASQGGHDVPDALLLARFARAQANLARAIERLPHVPVFDNSDLSRPYRLVERYRAGKPIDDVKPGEKGYHDSFHLYEPKLDAFDVRQRTSVRFWAFCFTPFESAGRVVGAAWVGSGPGDHAIRKLVDLHLRGCSLSGTLFSVL